MANSKSTKVKSSKQVKTAGKTAAKAKSLSPEHQLAQDAVNLKAKLDDENLKKKLLKEAMVAIREAIRYREEQEEAERVAAEEAAEAERLAAEEAQRRLEDAEDAEDDDFDGSRDGSDDDEDSDDDDASICSGDASVSGLDFAAIQRQKLEDAEDAEDEEEDARVEVVVVPARVGRPAPSFEGLVALRESPDYWEVEAALAASGCSLEGAGALPPLLVFDRGLVSSARVGAVTVTVDHKSRDRDVAIDEDGDIAAQTAKCVRTIRDVTKKLAPVKIALREFQGRKFVVDGGKVTVGAGKPAVYGNTIAVDRGLWDALAVEQQDAVLDAGAVVMRGSAPATEMLTVRDVGKAPAAPRGKAKRAAPAAKRGPAKKKLSAVVRQERGCTYYK